MGKIFLWQCCQRKNDRPASTVRRPFAASSLSVTSAVRQFADNVMQCHSHAVVAPARSTWANALSRTSISGRLREIERVHLLLRSVHWQE